MSNRVNPDDNNSKEFKSEITDSDRFKDISLLIYQQNKSLYKRYSQQYSSNNTLDKLALCRDSLNDLRHISKLQPLEQITNQSNGHKKSYSDTKLNNTIVSTRQTVTRICNIL